MEEIFQIRFVTLALTCSFLIFNQTPLPLLLSLSYGLAWFFGNRLRFGAPIFIFFVSSLVLLFLYRWQSAKVRMQKAAIVILLIPSILPTFFFNLRGDWMNLWFYSDEELLQVCRAGWWNKNRLLFHGFPGLLAFEWVATTPEKELKARLPNSAPPILRVSKTQRTGDPNGVMFNNTLLGLIHSMSGTPDAKADLRAWVLCEQCHRHTRLTAFKFLCANRSCSESELGSIESAVGGEIKPEIQKMITVYGGSRKPDRQLGNAKGS